MSHTGILVNCEDTNCHRHGVRFIPTTSEHEVDEFVGKTLAVRSCHECGICVIRDSSKDGYAGDVPESTTLSKDHPMAKDFKEMLHNLPGHVLGSWGMSPQEFGPCTIHGMVKLDSLASYYELGVACPGCGYKRES